MGIKLSELVVGERTIPAEYNGQTVTITYDPNKHTPALEAEWQAMQERGWAGPIAVDFVCKLLVDWDIQGRLEGDELVDSEDFLPIEPKTVQRLPELLLGAIAQAIGSDPTPGKARPPSRSQRRRH